LGFTSLEDCLDPLYLWVIRETCCCTHYTFLLGFPTDAYYAPSVANCGDQPVPLSSDELERIEEAGGASSFGREQTCLASSACRVLATMTIPEVTMTDRAEGDECMILANCGLWDMVTNEITCKVAFKMSFSKNTKGAPFCWF
jgi:hypothetical protein